MEPTIAATSRESYDPAFFETLFKAEEKHFWFRARNSAIAALVQQLAASFPPGYRVLEVGCGTGNVLRRLEGLCANGSVTGMDLFAEGLRFARQRASSRLVVGDVHRPPFAVGFDLIGLFDVLEHLPDDAQVLGDLNRMLLPGRVLLVTVPAHPELWSYFDVAARHCRRYRLEELRQKLLGSGFEVEYISEFMTALLPLVWVKRRLSGWRRLPPTDTARHYRELAARELRMTPLVNGLMTWLLLRETNRIARRRRLPFGSSILALARKAHPTG